MKNVVLTESKNGAQILLDSLEKAGVDSLFGYPGGAVIPLYDALYESSINHILVRHEQAASHAAEGYAKATGKPGVVLVTSGPGATNTVTGIADAFCDSVPLVVISGQVGSAAIGSDAFQELDILSITSSITKMSYQVRTVSELPLIVEEAFKVAVSGRPGPVLIDLPKSVMLAKNDENNHANTFFHQIDNAKPVVDTVKVRQLVAALSKARQPLIIAGAGVLKSNAQELLRTLMHRYHIPVVSTLLGLGAVDSDDQLFLGMVGMHGSVAANTAIDQADFILNIGSRFDDRVVTNVDDFGKNAIIAHVDIDATELEKVLSTTYAIHASADDALNAILSELKNRTMTDTSAWQNLNQHAKGESTFHYHKLKTAIMPQEVIQAVGEVTEGNAIVVTDVGQHQMWAAQFYPFKHNYQMITSGGLGTMGYGLPAAIGAKFARREKEVVLFVGDGGFQMTSEELAILNDNNLNIKIVMFNNHSLGMVRQWQTLFFDGRLSNTVFKSQPRFDQLAQAYDINYARIDNPNSMFEELQEAFDSDKSILIEVIIPDDVKVLPMVNAGAAYRDMITEEEA
ncbi:MULTISPECIES: biosynthetic-type acetolactate synthase large subunit [Leuconostoc]|uniref:Acetolactate synthase n=1 Tax=Leuconostoc suionicum TaxID=1511761 RepID=A0A2N9KFD4_9LACO|nr:MULTISPECIES: biosynthetic-type acetolactate synthase large subunit [Leuconostoc]API72880.1 acetolactate synthase 2 catalytic subunit [Leuconostoc suionicum]MBE4726871.1 biosynthetic-type acetolactate synthase large subunit [Leuconostoc suionicum]MCT4376213.1 biosynthetic-type acetolactate synthase large subunit [Leuconostoc suionicum]MCT4402750.1 biosynthetic-type acetolactate synthase large subunit [Leuconostoc suionicum]MDI6522838.1 biosynthetic-type acetolactate synthase large subunit [